MGFFVKSVGICLALFFTAVSSGCSSNLSRFDLLKSGKHKTSSGLQVSRHEIADQGAGAARASVGAAAGWSVSRVTIGGSYARRIAGVAGPSGPNSPSGAGPSSPSYQFSAGLHAEPSR